MSEQSKKFTGLDSIAATTRVMMGSGLALVLFLMIGTLAFVTRHSMNLATQSYLAACLGTSGEHPAGSFYAETLRAFSLAAWEKDAPDAYVSILKVSNNQEMRYYAIIRRQSREPICAGELRELVPGSSTLAAFLTYEDRVLLVGEVLPSEEKDPVFVYVETISIHGSETLAARRMVSTFGREFIADELGLPGSESIGLRRLCPLFRNPLERSAYPEELCDTSPVNNPIPNHLASAVNIPSDYFASDQNKKP